MERDGVFGFLEKRNHQKTDFRHHYTGIVSQKQNIFTVIRNKKALSCFDSKRWIFNCGIHSSPFGSILIDRYKNKCYKCVKPKLPYIFIQKC